MLSTVNQEMAMIAILSSWWCAFGFHERQIIYRPAEMLFASQESMLYKLGWYGSSTCFICDLHWLLTIGWVFAHEVNYKLIKMSRSKYRIFSRNLRTFFYFGRWKIGVRKISGFFLWKSCSGFYYSITENTLRFVNILL